MNNTPDYENDLAFKPELTWEELREWVKDKIEPEFEYPKSWFEIEIGEATATFWCDGDIVIEGAIIANNKTPAQTKTIIEALR